MLNGCCVTAAGNANLLTSRKATNREVKERLLKYHCLLVLVGQLKEILGQQFVQSIQTIKR